MMDTCNLISPREEDRLFFDADALMKDARGGSTTATIENLSASGCTIRFSAPFLEVGAAIVVRLSGLEGLTGTVRWVRGPRAGIHFDRPLYVALLEHLAEQDSATPAKGHC